MNLLSERNAPAGMLAAGALGAVALFASGHASLGVWSLLGGVLLTAVYQLWQSARLLAGDTQVVMELDGARFDPRGLDLDLDEEKRAVLTQLKDLERERRIGKLSEADYTELADDYRERAKHLLAAIDKELAPQMEEAKRLLEAKEVAP